MPEQQRLAFHIPHNQNVWYRYEKVGIIGETEHGLFISNTDRRKETGVSGKYQTTPNLRLETIPGTLRVPVWLYGCPHCFNGTAAEFQSFPGKQEDKQQKICFQQDDIYYWRAVEHEVTDGVSVIASYISVFNIYSDILENCRLAQRANEDCSKRNLIICYKTALIIHTTPSWVKTKIQN